MLLYLLSTTDPAVNLATEETLLTEKREDCLLLWRNRPTVVYGCNQSLLKEIDLPYLKEHGISFVRRISGGGAVYHDFGNINFSFLTGYREGEFCDFSRFCQPVIDYLNTLGLPAVMNGRNDMTVNGAKFSGNAQAVRKNRLLHHGTILFDTDLTVLSRALLPDPEKLSGKGISSVRSRVTNLRPLLKDDKTPEAFLAELYAHFAAQPENIPTELSDGEKERIRALAERKYRSFDWLYSRSPDYTFTNHRRFSSGGITVYLKTEDAVITDVSFSGDFFGLRDPDELCALLKGTRHTPEDVLERLKTAGVERYFSSLSPQELLSLFF